MVSQSCVQYHEIRINPCLRLLVSPLKPTRPNFCCCSRTRREWGSQYVNNRSVRSVANSYSYSCPGVQYHTSIYVLQVMFQHSSFDLCLSLNQSVRTIIGVPVVSQSVNEIIGVSPQVNPSEIQMVSQSCVQYHRIRINPCLRFLVSLLNSIRPKSLLLSPFCAQYHTIHLNPFGA